MGFANRHPELVSGSITFATRQQGREPQIAGQVPPSGIALFNKIDLPLPTPILDLLFSRDRRFHRLKALKINEHMNVVSAGKAAKRTVAVLVNPRHEIGCNPDIERFAKPAGKDVGAGLAVSHNGKRSAGRWTLKQVQGDDKGEKVIPQTCHAELVSASIAQMSAEVA